MRSYMEHRLKTTYYIKKKKKKQHDHYICYRGMPKIT